MSSGIVISGVGHCLPTHAESNEELCRRVPVSADWILAKTGIRQRYKAGPEDRASEFARRAAADALRHADVAAEHLDLIIACTFSGDYIFPPLSASLHHDLGAARAQIFDLQANCCGFVTGLTLAADRMRADPGIKTALVVGVEFCTRYIDGTDVETAMFLADGAGAAVVTRTPAARGIRASAFDTDSSNFEAVRLRGGGSSFRGYGRAADARIDLMEMNGLATWKQAITHLPRVMREACSKGGIAPGEIDFLVFHQANLRLIEYIMKKMGFRMDQTFTNVQDVGNTGSASLPIALSEAVAQGRLHDGDRVMLAAVGAGFNFAASLWDWAECGKRQG